MKNNSSARLADVQKVYSGAEGRLWELLMGEQIHIGGFQSSIDLATRAGIGEGQKGVDLCCATGAGMRFLLRMMKVATMTGVDATATMVALGRKRCEEEGLASRVTFLEQDVCASGLTTGAFDFVWGEDAWCYVEDKATLVSEAARLVRPGGKIAFTDWMEGPEGLGDEESERLLRFMKFPSLANLEDYRTLLEESGIKVHTSADTGRFPDYLPLYLDMIERQLTYDALKIIGFDTKLADELVGEMKFLKELADGQKVIQGLVIAEKPV